MFFLDHAPPHFHAEYGDFRAIIDIKNLEVMEGFLPSKELKLVQAWGIIHEAELMENFLTLNSDSPSWKKIEPLK